MSPVLAQVDFGQTFGEAWAGVVELIPQALLFLVILVAGWFVARAVAGVLDTVLEKVGFDRWVERGGIRRTLAGTDYDASDLLAKVVFYALFLLVLQLAFGVFGPNPVSDLIEGIVAYLPNVFVAILILVVAAYLAAAVRDITTAALGGASYGGLLATGAYVAVLVIGIFAALTQLQIAPAIVVGLFYALLAIVVGSAIVAIGGGGIAPMRSRIESWLERAEGDLADARRRTDGDDGARPAARRPRDTPRRPVERSASVSGRPEPRGDPRGGDAPAN